MHYHIFWGPRTAPEPFIMNFSDENEALDNFVSLIQTMEGKTSKDEVPPWKEKKFDENCTILQVNGEKNKYMLVVCNYACHKEVVEPAMMN